MEDENLEQQTSSTTNRSENNRSSSSSSNSSTRERGSSEPVRSRWTPKPEQILILESIFNSGMVNPPKEETVRIRKLLEKFGAVGDANVFYWFQNRRSRSRRRQRQLQAASLAAVTVTATTIAGASTQVAVVTSPPLVGVGGYEYGGSGVVTTCTATVPSIVGSPCPSSSTAFGGVDQGFGNLSGQMGSVLSDQLESNSSQPSIFCSSDASNLDFPSGIITVFINGVATQVPEGPLDVKAMFGEEVIFVHSSGVPVPFNEFGISFQSLHHGESYFLVPRLN